MSESWPGPYIGELTATIDAVGGRLLDALRALGNGQAAAQKRRDRFALSIFVALLEREPMVSMKSLLDGTSNRLADLTWKLADALDFADPARQVGEEYADPDDDDDEPDDVCDLTPPADDDDDDDVE